MNGFKSPALADAPLVVNGALVRSFMTPEPTVLDTDNQKPFISTELVGGDGITGDTDSTDENAHAEQSSSDDVLPEDGSKNVKHVWKNGRLIAVQKDDQTES